MANKVTLLGRLTKDPVLEYTQNNKAYIRFNLAVDKNLTREKRQELESKNQPTADFINCVCFGSMAETISKYSGKGLRILINGRIQTGSFEKDGQRVFTTDVVANNIEFIDWANADNNSNSNFQNGNNSNGSFEKETNWNNFNEEFEYNENEDKGRIPF